MSGTARQSSAYDSDYHDRQFVTPYRSTVAFCDWLVELGALGAESRRICDLGCGKGANLYYMSRRFPDCSFVGLDIDEQLISDGRDFLARASVANCRLVAGDLHDAGRVFPKARFDGVLSLQTLSWLPGYERALDAIVSMSPRWIALTSLFYEGPIEARTLISELDPLEGGRAARTFHYNTYSLPQVGKYLSDRGYGQFRFTRFEIPIDLPRSAEAKMQTYTETTVDGRRLQVSGPLLMNWYFIYAAIA
jgi:ubiquinone/menaquinone biosynthesis C-methylase UbiE